MILLDELPLSIKEECRSSNIQAVTVHISKKELIIEPHFKICRIPTILRIDREKQVAFECQPPIDIMPDSTPRLLSHFLGVLNMKGKKVLIMAE